MTPWTCVLCEGEPGCPGMVVLRLDGDHSSLVTYTEADGMIRSYACSSSALVGAQRGLRTHIVSESGECVLEKDGDFIHLKLYTRDDKRFDFRITKAAFANGLSKMAETKAAKQIRFY